MNWPFVAISVVATGITAGRLWSQRDRSATTTHKAILVSLFSIVIGAMAYGTRSAVDHFLLIGDVLWHICACTLIGALEIISMMLRDEQVDSRKLRSVTIRTSAIIVLMIVAWPAYLDNPAATTGVISMQDHDLASFTYLIAFPAFCIWGMFRIATVGWGRILPDLRRRPINTIAMAMISAGIFGFIWVNVTLMVYLNTEQSDQLGDILKWSPLFLSVSVSGTAVLVFGERLYDELVAWYELRRLTPLWRRLIELSEHDLHLSAENLTTPARLQRAYVEISDAICTVRLVVDRPYTVDAAVEALREGAVSDNPQVPTLSQALPERKTRREDLELISQLASEYRAGATTGSSAEAARA
ncbi:hypothetical protein AB0I24_15450 [Brachybacterium paraconglomeratum]